MIENKTLTTPVLLLAFNRPKKTEQVFEAIRDVRPSKLYVAVDAPREGRMDDVENCNEVKSIVSNVDWPCETHYLFQEKNLGCSLSGVTAWNWVFETEDRLIFVEDDGLATRSAFFFVQEMLEKYKDDNRVAYVGGVNYGIKSGQASYYFSRQPVATYFMGVWKRVQNLYEYDMESYENDSSSKSFRVRFGNCGEFLLMDRIFKKYRNSVKEGKRDNTYDVQMIYLSYKYNMYSIYPNVNMVSNIGLDGGANNSVNPNSKFYKKYANRKRLEMEEIVFLKDFLIDEDIESQMFKERVLHQRPWITVWAKSLFLQYFGTFYSKYIRPIRRGNR